MESPPLVELSSEGSDINTISGTESDDDDLPSTRDGINVPEGPDLSMIPDVCPSRLSMPSTAGSTDGEEDHGWSTKPTRPENEDYEPSAEENTQPKEESQKEATSDSKSEAHDDARVGNGTITTESFTDLEERSSIGTSHESGETWQPVFSDYSWL